jgi:methyltransferase (TIGR00027 family)
VRAALSAGIGQIVLLGAGYAARAYRLIAPGPVVFEVDHPDTLARKRAVVVATLGELPPHVRYVPTDFNAGRLPAAMEAAGFDPERRALVVWEGVTNYLTEAGVDETLRWCAETAPGSRLVFTYVHRAVLDDPGAFAGTRRLFATLDAAGERWTFGLEPAGLAAYLAARGLTLDEDVGAAEYRRLCFGRAADAMRGYEFYRIACTHVEEGEG